MNASIAAVEKALDGANLRVSADRKTNYPFHKDPAKFNVFWDVRKGLIPIVGGGRETGTSMLIEDVAVEVDKLGALTMDLIEMFQRHGYKDASCFGHALEGNLHLVFSQARAGAWSKGGCDALRGCAAAVRRRRAAREVRQGSLAEAKHPNLLCCVLGAALTRHSPLRRPHPFPQGFRTAEEVERYDAMMQELCSLVAEKHGGSLKAEHGTGRNVAPFVEMEWGTQAFELMWELKELFDPNYVLNPGVILNGDPDVHKKSLKPSPPAHPLVDRCIECGFCESNCPSRDVTLTPRQRITVFREISRLKARAQRGAAADPAPALQSLSDPALPTPPPAPPAASSSAARHLRRIRAPSCPLLLR